MAEELEMKDLQMKGLTEKIQSLLDGIDKSKRKELDLNDIAARIKEFTNALEAASIEYRRMNAKGNNPNKNEQKQMLKDHKNILKEFKNQYEWKKSEAVKDELLGDHKAGGDEDRETAEGLMKYGYY